MTITVNLVAADGATSSVTLPDPTVSAATEGPFASQCITCVIGGQTLALDYTASIGATPDAGTGIIYQAPSLKPFTGAAGQLWSYEQLTNSAILAPVNLGWFDLDGENLWFGVPWDNSTSTGNMAESGAVSFTYGATYLQPTSDGTGVQMAPTPFTWTMQAPAADPPPPVQSSYIPAGYVTAFEDTFTGTSLDTTKWWTRYAGNDGTQQSISSNGEMEVFEEGQDGEPNHVMTGNSVKLTAYGPRASDGLYPSGMLRCKQTLNLGSLTTAFYVEIVAKIPNAQGSWPALWFSAEPHSPTVPPPWPPEMDFAEFMNNAANGDNSTMLGVNVQLNGQNPPNVWNSDNWSYGPNTPAGWTWSATGRTKWVTPIDFSAGFHIFGFWCVPGVAGQQTVNPITGQPTHMLFYYCDGYNTFNSQYDANVGADGSTGWNAELLIDLAVGGMGGGTPNPAQFPCDLEIQRVTIALSQNDPAALVLSTIGQNFLPATGG